VSGERHASADLSPVNSHRHLLERRLGWPQSWSESDEGEEVLDSSRDSAPTHPSFSPQPVALPTALPQHMYEYDKRNKNIFLTVVVSKILCFLVYRIPDNGQSP
jgi:hypothetical protein